MLVESDLASRTMQRASSALQSSQIACLPEIVKLLRTLSGNTEDVSVLELADVIQNDAVVMSKVIAAANTLYYNPNAVPVSSVVQAIHVIGYERIRTLSMSLMLAEQAARGTSAEDQRKIAAQSLTAGCFAQSIAENRLLLDKEQAFVCGCLRSFGHVVLANCMADDYRQAQQLGENLPDDEAYRQIFGLTPLELGHQLLKAANLPEEILVTLRALPPETIAVLDNRPDQQMLALVSCAEQLAKLACNPDLSPHEFATRSASLVNHYQKALPDLAGEMPHLMQNATHHLDYLVRTFRLRSVPTQTLTRLRSCRNAVTQVWTNGTAAAAAPTATGEAPRLASRPPPADEINAPPPSRPVVSPTPVAPVTPAAPPAGVTAPPGSVSPFGAHHTGLPPLTMPEHDWQHSMNQLANLLRSPQTTPAMLQRRLVETIAQGLGAPECLFFAHDAHLRACPLVQGEGRLYQALKPQREIVVRTDDRTVFGVCLQRQENINIHHAREPRIRPYLPAWLHGRPEVGAFVLLPFTDTGPSLGVLLAGWPEACQINLPASCARSLRTIIATAFRVQRKLAG